MQCNISEVFHITLHLITHGDWIGIDVLLKNIHLVMKLLGHECQGDATFSHNLNICHVEKKKWHISISKAEKIRDKREYAQCSPETGDPSHMTQTDTPELSTVEEKVNKKNSELDECPPDW